MNIRKYLIAALLISAPFSSELFSQLSGNPTWSSGKGIWSMSAGGAYINQQVGSEIEISRRYILKSSWGITPWLDFYLMGGAVQLELQSQKDMVSDFRDKFRFACGFGFHMAHRLGSLGSVSLYSDIQALRFVSQGSFIDDFEIEGQMFLNHYKMKYDWREFRGQAGIVVPYGSFRFYVAGAVWYLWRLEKKREYREYGSEMSFLGEYEGEYLSDVWTGGIAGIELVLPKRYAITLECLFFNMNNYHIMIGICQTGRLGW